MLAAAQGANLNDGGALCSKLRPPKLTENRYGLKEALERLRAVCRGLPEVEERLSHGTPAFYVRGRMFAQLWDDHHGDGRLALWCAAPLLAQETLIELEPHVFFRPPYVGHRGWLGVRLDRGLDWERVERMVSGAYETVVGRSRPKGGRARPA